MENKRRVDSYRLIELQAYLEGLTCDMAEPFLRLAEILEHQVFELCEIRQDEENTYAVPYMMNDALEYYLILRDCRMVGEYLKHTEEVVTARIAKEEEGYALAVRQGKENVFTLHFRELEEKVNCYQYHAIGHFWVKGQEQWRQLVYMIGTIYDKYEYLGDKFCNQKELELLRLMEFAPFREWSPVHESLEERYPATYEGIDVMEELSYKAADKAFSKWIHLYRRFPSKRVEKVLCRKMQGPGRQALYELIWKMVKEASETYPKRRYGHGLNEIMQTERERVHEQMKKRGFTGRYPEYEKDHLQVIVTEEHPFTIADMEYEDYSFRMQYMVSEYSGKPLGRNAGFFRGRGRKGWIAASLEELE